MKSIVGSNSKQADKILTGIAIIIYLAIFSLLVQTRSACWEFSTRVGVFSVVGDVGLTILFGVLFMRRMRKSKLGDVFGRQINPLIIIGIVLGLIALRFIVAYFWGPIKFGTALSVHHRIAETFPYSGGNYQKAMMFTFDSVVGAAFLEEMLVRGIGMYTLIKIGVQPILAIVVTAIIFTLGHGIYVDLDMFFHFCEGIIFGVVAWEKGLINSIEMHGLMNVILLFISFMYNPII